MKEKMINKIHIEGYLYQHKLEKKVSGPKSRNPGVEFITGTIEIATDNSLINIVPVHFTYVTAKTKSDRPNKTYTVLSNIIDGVYGSMMEHGIDNAVKLKMDSAIGLNDFYSYRENPPALVSSKRNEGSFNLDVVTGDFVEEKERARFEVDMIITNTTFIDADEERNLPEKLILKGAIFDFRKTLLPVDFSVVNKQAIDYFESLNASPTEPVFTKVRGNQVAETIVRTITEESAFGEPSVREVKSVRKDYIVNWATNEPYIWDDASTITAKELREAMAARETYLSTVKARSDEYQNAKTGGAKASAGAFVAEDAGFKF